MWRCLYMRLYFLNNLLYDFNLLLMFIVHRSLWFFIPSKIYQRMTDFPTGSFYTDVVPEELPYTSTRSHSIIFSLSPVNSSGYRFTFLDYLPEEEDVNSGVFTTNTWWETSISVWLCIREDWRMVTYQKRSREPEWWKECLKRCRNLLIN